MAVLRGDHRRTRTELVPLAMGCIAARTIDRLDCAIGHEVDGNPAEIAPQIADGIEFYQ